jgi:xanthine/CO dehydrogenase XdhC/CoxF family maturation factor
MRLILVGEDEALDVLADLSRHLEYFEVSRLDDPPDRALDADDHLVIGARDAAHGRQLLEAALRHGSPGVATIVPDPDGDSPGARAILVAAELVAAVRGRPRG